MIDFVPPQIGFRQFRRDACLSYCLFDPLTRQAAFVDPAVDQMDDYRSLIGEERLEVRWVIDTQLHDDHFSASHLLRAETGAEIGMSRHTRSQRPTQRFGEGASFALGERRFRIHETPGHTADSLVIEGPGFVLTGDTLLIGCVGRTDYAEGDPRRLWESLQEVLGKFDPATLVFPAHDSAFLLFSTIGTERARNAQWSLSSVEEFVELKCRDKVPREGEEAAPRVTYNLEANPSVVPEIGPGRPVRAADSEGSGSLERIPSISVQKLAKKLVRPEPGSRVVDVREPGEFQAGHIPGASNLPLSALPFCLRELSKAKRLYVYCLSDPRSAMVTNTLAHLGVGECVNVDGGYRSWVSQGYKVEKQK